MGEEVKSAFDINEYVSMVNFNVIFHICFTNETRDFGFLNFASSVANEKKSV